MISGKTVSDLYPVKDFFLEPNQFQVVGYLDGDPLMPVPIGILPSSLAMYFPSKPSVEWEFDAGTPKRRRLVVRPLTQDAMGSRGPLASEHTDAELEGLVELQYRDNVYVVAVPFTLWAQVYADAKPGGSEKGKKKGFFSRKTTMEVKDEPNTTL